MAQSNGRTQGIAMKIALGDPDSPGHVLKPNADGSINVAGGGGGGDVNITEIGGETVEANFGAIGDGSQRVVAAIQDGAGNEIDWSDPVPIIGVDGTTIATAANPFPVHDGALALTDGSDTLTTGGTAEEVFAAGSVVNGYEVINPDPTEDLWISDTTTALANGKGSIRVAANGGTYSSPPGMKPSAALSLVAATTGHKYTARRW